MGKGLLGVFSMVILALGSIVAQAESRFDELVDLHKTGPISPRLHAQADDNLQFICFGKDDPNRPVHVSIGYHGLAQPAFRALAHDASSDSLRLARLIEGRNFALVLSHIPAFDGQLLAGQAMWENAYSQLDASDVDSVRVGISLHEPSQKHLAIVFKVQSDNGESDGREDCKLKDQIEYACIEAAAEL